MKSYVLFLIAWILVFPCYAQNNRVELNYFGGFFHRILKTNDQFVSEDPSFQETFINNRNNIEIPAYGFSSGFTYLTKEKNRISYCLGLNYVRGGSKLDMSKLSFGDTIDPRHGIAYEPSPKIYKTLNSHSFVELPIGINYSFIQKEKFSFFVRPLISLDYYVGSATVFNSNYSSSSTRKNPFFHVLKPSAHLMVGCQWHLTPKFSFLLSTLGNMNLVSNYLKDPINPFNEKFYSYGFNFAVSYSFSNEMH